MTRWVDRGLAVLLLAASTSLWACPICFRGMALTTAQHLAASERAVLAVAAPDGRSLEIVEIVKGRGSPGETLDAAVHGLAPGAMRTSEALLMVHSDLSPAWIAVGAVGRKHADFLRRIAASTPDTVSADARWREHVAFLLPYHENSDPMIAGIAHAELERAPYAALRSLKPRLDAVTFVRGLDDPGEQALDTLLYGIGGGPQDAARIEQRLDAAWTAKSATNVAALLTADMELRGPSRVAWIEKMYFADRGRTLPEIQAALLALSVQGSADGAVPRQRVIEAYRVFMKERKPMAAYVAQDLARWSYWDAGPELVSLLKSDALPDPASRVAVIAYLMQSPRADARAAVKAFTAASK
ncbi:MAG: hypothetical protein ABWY07_04235 [Burkholderiales bacterium]